MNNIAQIITGISATAVLAGGLSTVAHGSDFVSASNVMKTYPNRNPIGNTVDTNNMLSVG